MSAVAAPRFLTAAEVHEIHDLQLALFGGAPGVRDPEALAAALAAPQALHHGSLLHADPCAQAAAYLLHLSENRPFVDGNKRTALHSMLLFLVLNRIPIPHPRPDLYELTMAVADGRLCKPELTETLGRLFPR